MDDEKRNAARDKLVHKACNWHEWRQVKQLATGDDRIGAQTKLRQSEHELAEAVEKYKKVER